MHSFTTELLDREVAFSVSVLEPEDVRNVVLFAVGGGGNPERHHRLLHGLAKANCLVVAPHFERLLSPRATEDEVLLRARRLSLALASLGRSDLPTIGVGHSIGAAMLLALAGGSAWLSPDCPLQIEPDARLDRLALMAPATAFFQAPNALAPVRTPMLVYAASEDVITPPSQAKFLQQELGRRVPVELYLVKGADHFSFMDVLPPQVIDVLPDRDRFLAEMAEQITHFIMTDASYAESP